MPLAAIRTYLFFNGRCEEAVAFYTAAVGAKLEMLMRFKDSPQPVPADQIPPDFGDKVMHCSFLVGDTCVMASDGCEVGATFQGFSLCLTTATEAEAERAFAALADGGRVKMPLAKTFWSPKYGMLVDRFGVEWMVMVAGEANS